MMNHARAAAVAVAAFFSTAAVAEDFVLTSADIAEGGALAERHVFNGFGCTGANVSPALAWSGAPEGVKSYAVTAYDPDAPTGSGWWHWIAYDIPASITALERGAGSADGLPDGAAHGPNDYGSVGFGGACPPPGEVHRYEFRVFALDVAALELPEGASAALTGFMINAHTLDSAKITAAYTR